MLISTEKWTTHPNNCRKGQCVIRNAACVIWFLWRRSLLDNMTIIQQPKHIRLQVWPFCSYLNWVFQPPFTFAIETSSKWLTLQPPTWMYTNLPGGWLLCLYLWVDPWKSETLGSPQGKKWKVLILKAALKEQLGICCMEHPRKMRQKASQEQQPEMNEVGGSKCRAFAGSYLLPWWESCTYTSGIFCTCHSHKNKVCSKHALELLSSALEMLCMPHAALINTFV